MPRRDYFNTGKRVALEVKEEYDEGESGSEFKARLKDLGRRARLQRIAFLWRKAYLRARGGSQLLRLFYGLHKHLLLAGTTRNLFADASDRHAKDH